MSDDSSDDSKEESKDDEKDAKAAASSSYQMMMSSYGAYGYPSAYSYAAYAQAYPQYAAAYSAYGGYGSSPADYTAYMQQMAAAGYGSSGYGASGAPGIASDPMAAYYGSYGGCGGLVPNMHYGTIKTFLAEKGFGFIDCVTSIEGDIFFSKNELPSDLAEAKELRGKSVQFEITMGKDGRNRATSVTECTREMVERAMSAAPRPQGTQATGTVKSYSERNGYGFLALPEEDQTTQRDAQFKGSDLSPGLQALGWGLVGVEVQCQVHQLPDGKLKATDIAPKPGAQMPKGGKGKGKGGFVPVVTQRTQGTVTEFDESIRLGVLKCDECEEVHFFDAKNLSLAKDVEVTFGLKYIADGSAQAVDVSLCEESTEPVILKDGTTVTATVKSFNDQRGFGFVKVTGSGMDLYFHARDLDDASQGLLMLVGGQNASGCTAMCRVEARADGRWNARNMTILEAGVNMLDGMKLAGMIRCFYDHKGFGFINCTGNPVDIYFQGRDVGHDAQKRCEDMGAVGTVVWFTVYAQTESRWQAREIVLAGDGSSPGGITPDMLGPKGWGKGMDYDPSWDYWGMGPMDYGDYGGKGWGKGPPPKVEKQVIPGCELVGRIKSYNAEKNFGFISLDGQYNDVYFQIWDLTEAVKQQLEAVGPDGSGITSGALVHFWLQLMPGGGRLRARDVSTSHGANMSDAAAVDAAVQKAAQVAHEAIIPGTGTLLYDGAEVSGTIRTFNKDRGYGFVNVDCDETDLYFHVKDMHPDDQQKVAQGFNLVGSRVWFWAEMLDNGMTGRWRCHEVSMTFKRGGQGEVPPAKRQRTEGPGGPGGPNVNGT